MTQTSDALNETTIIILFGSLELGGAERQGLRFSIYLKKEFNAHVEVWGFNSPGKTTEICEKNKIPWKIVPNPLVKNPVKRLFLLQKLIQELNKTRPDILLPYTLIPNVVAGLSWRKTSARLCVWNQRDTGTEHFNQRVEHTALANIPLIVSNSHAGAEMLAGKYGIELSKIHVVPNAIEMDAPVRTRKEWRHLLNIDDCAFVACMVANLSKSKDHETLIKAWKIVADTSKNLKFQKPHLVLPGRFDDTYDSLKKLVIRYGLSDTIHFLGKVDDITGLLLSVELGIHSSHSEGCPNGILECMAVGLPVIGTDIPGIREAVGAGNTGFLVPRGNPDRLAEKIEELMRDNILRERMGVLNKNRILNHFNPAEIWKKQSALIADHTVNDFS